MPPSQPPALPAPPRSKQIELPSATRFAGTTLKTRHGGFFHALFALTQREKAISCYRFFIY
jgi:hypothetical protein